MFRIYKDLLLDFCLWFQSHSQASPTKSGMGDIYPAFTENSLTKVKAGRETPLWGRAFTKDKAPSRRPCEKSISDD